VIIVARAESRTGGRDMQNISQNKYEPRKITRAREWGEGSGEEAGRDKGEREGETR